MSAAWEATIGTAAGAVVGGGAVVVGNYVSARMAARQSAAAWKRERRAQRRDTQRVCIIELQDSLAAFLRCTAQIAWTDVGARPDLAEEQRVASVRVRVLASRAGDASMRTAALHIVRIAQSALMANTRQESDALLIAAGEATHEVDDRVAALLDTL